MKLKERVKEIAQFPDFKKNEMRFLCGCIVKKTNKNKKTWQCSKHTQHGEGLRLYPTHLSLIHTMKRAMVDREDMKTYLRRECLEGCNNTDNLGHICIICQEKSGLIYWDGKSCTSVCKPCLELIFEEILE